MYNQNAMYVAGTSFCKCIYVPAAWGACSLVEVSTETWLHVNVYVQEYYFYRTLAPTYSISKSGGSTSKSSSPRPFWTKNWKEDRFYLQKEQFIVIITVNSSGYNVNA